MINNIYAKAYTEVLEIISHFSRDEISKIPAEKIEFYKANRDKDYQFKINPEMDLSEQNISKEANAIIVTLFRDYYATEEQKNRIKEILELNQLKEEKEKELKFNSDNLFKKQESIALEKTPLNLQLVECKETFFTKFKNFILKLLHISDKK